MLRKILILAILSTSLGCGVAENLGRECGGSMKEGCRTLFGGEWNEEQDRRISDNSAAIAVLEQNNLLIMQLLFQQMADLAVLQQNVDTVDSTVSTIVNNISNLQTLVNNNTANIAVLQGYQNITKLVDPCGDTPGKYDEVFFRLSSGKIVASFSDSASGLNTRFAELMPGTYSTTDGTGCVFSVSASRIVTPSVEY